MASEAQKQKQLIDSGFLEGLGGSKEKEPAFDSAEKVFVKWMGLLITELQKNLNNEGIGMGGYSAEITASGALSESIHLEYRRTGAAFEGRIYMLDYADYVDKGVQGIGPGSKNTTSPYRFRTPGTSKNMRDALVKWIAEKNVLSTITTNKGLLGPHTQQKLQNKIAAQSLAEAIGRSIKRKGLKARPFKSVSVDAIVEGMNKEMAKALVQDIKIDINLSVLQ